MSVNKVILIGHLGADPEVRASQSGNQVARISLATTERVRDRDGNWSDRTEWHKVVCFGRTAENAGRHLRKGRQVYVEGRLQTRKWQDRDGNDRYTTEVVANDVRFLGKPDGSRPSSNVDAEPEGDPGPGRAGPYDGGADAVGAYDDSDIPF